MNQPDPDAKPPTTLGLVKVPEGLIEHDLAVSDRYQAFSAEIVRLALLGIAAIGFLVVNVFLKPATPSQDAQLFVTLSLIGFGVSTAAGLLHRYAGADSVSCHLRLLRLVLRGGPDDDKMAAGERRRRGLWFRVSWYLLAIACVGLWAGAMLLAVALILCLP